MMSQPLFRSSVAVLAMLASALVQAQTQRSGGGEAQKFMQQYQQLAGEKTALQTQLAQMQKDLDNAQTQLAAVKKERDALKAHSVAPTAAMAQLAAGKETAEKNLEQSKQRLTDLVTRFRETATNLRDVEADRTKLQSELKDKSGAYDKCAVDNLGLFEVNSEILDRYEHVGMFTKVSAEEPFTRITRTRINNLVDEYRTRALELRAAKTSSP